MEKFGTDLETGTLNKPGKNGDLFSHRYVLPLALLPQSKIKYPTDL